jgi:uncharacterized membrane protein YhiD involved in acid resistance
MNSPGASKGGDSSNIVTVLAAVATAIGTLGWVTFIGGAIVWISFSQANLPAAEAIAKVPTSVLVATGAEFVAFAFVAALATIVVLYFFDDRVQRLEIHRTIKQKDRLARELREKKEREADLARIAQQSADPLRALEKQVTASDEAVAEAKQQHDEAQQELERARESVKDVNESLVAASASLTEQILRGLLPAALLAGTAIIAAFLVDLGYGHIPLQGIIVVCAVAIAAGIIGAILYRTTARFTVMGLVALIAVPLVMAVATYYRAGAAPRVEPVALLRIDGSPFVGFFIAETPDRVFVGTFDERTPDPCTLLRRQSCESDIGQTTVPARLLSLPASDVQNLTVGPRVPLNANDALTDPTRPRTAREWAAGAALRLCEAASAARQEAEASGASGTNGTPATLPTVCSQEEVEYLRQFDAEERRVVDALSREAAG